MTGTRLRWSECVLVGTLLFGVLSTSSTLLLYLALVRPVPGDILSPRPDDVIGLYLAGAIAGTLAWRLLVTVDRATPRRGALAGLLAGLAVYPLTPLVSIAVVRPLALLGILAYQQVTGHGVDLANFPWLRFGLWVPLAFAAFYFLWSAWIGAPVGALLGFVWTKARPRFALAPRLPTCRRPESEHDRSTGDGP
jgi:hypothetical protein